MNRSELSRYPRPQDRSLQLTVERDLGDFVEVDKTFPQERISARMYERIKVIEVHTISSQESVEVDKTIPQERNSERMCEQFEGIEMSKISYQESVDAV